MHASGKWLVTRRPILRFCMPVACLLAGQAQAQNADSFRDAAESSVDYRSTPYRAQGRCEDFISRTDASVTVLSARVHEGGDTPAHCRITGIIPAEVLFEVNLPLAWNGRLYMYGNGGFAGSPPSTRAAVRDRALRNGFSTAYTNTGHDARTEPGATFAHDDLQKTVDYLFRAVHLTVARSKELVSDFYGRQADWSYWDGCSMGGRQGMVSAQRFPDDFDGIVAGAPAFDFTGTMMAYAWQGRLMRQLSLSEDKLDVLADTVYERCDTQDGVRDGLIGDPRQCDFSPRKHLPRCSASGNDGACFDDAEIRALEGLYRGFPREVGASVPGIIPGSEVAAPAENGDQMVRGWEPWLINDQGVSFQVRMAESYFRYLAFQPDDPDYDWMTYPLHEEPPGLDRLTAELLDAKATDLQRFRARGGKLIAYFGWADAAISPLPILDYYDRLAAAMDGPPDDVFRLYMIPGMFHCTGGVGAHEVDFMSPLIDWVEAGKAPADLAGLRHEKGELKLARPQCPWPERAVRDAAGGNDAVNGFHCEAPGE